MWYDEEINEGRRDNDLFEDSAAIRRQNRLRDLLLEFVEWRGNVRMFDMSTFLSNNFIFFYSNEYKLMCSECEFPNGKLWNDG